MALKNKGNDLFAKGLYEEAASTYTEALRVCPLSFEKDRAILYANRGAARVKCSVCIYTTQNSCFCAYPIFEVHKLTFYTFQFQPIGSPAIQDCTKAIELDPAYVKAYLRRAHFYEADDKLDEALEDYKKVLTFDPRNTESMCATAVSSNLEMFCTNYKKQYPTNFLLNDRTCGFPKKLYKNILCISRFRENPV